MNPRRLPALSLPLAVLLVGACSPEAEEAPAPAEKAEAPPVPVEVARLQTAGFEDAIKVFGRIEAKEEVRITAELAGRIEGLPFDEGQRVGRGQILARINARIARAQLDQAKAQAELARAELNRVAQLVDKKLGTEQQLEMSRAQAAQADAGAELARANLDKAVIRSPIDGVVTGVSAEKGEIAGPGTPLLQVVALDAVDVVADIPERDIAFLEEGTAIEVRVDALPGRPFPGKIRRIGLVANRATRTFPIKVRIDNADRLLRPGMLASFDLVRRTYEDVLVIPRDAVIDGVNTKTVYVVDGGLARPRAVTLGPARGRFTVVTRGLSTDDALILLGHRQVVDGQKVEVRRSSPCCRAQIDPAPAAPEARGPGGVATANEEAP